MRVCVRACSSKHHILFASMIQYNIRNSVHILHTHDPIQHSKLFSYGHAVFLCPHASLMHSYSTNRRLSLATPGEKDQASVMLRVQVTNKLHVYTGGGLQLGELTATFACQSTDRQPASHNHAATRKGSLTLVPQHFEFTYTYYLFVTLSPSHKGQATHTNGVLGSCMDAVFVLLVQKQEQIWTSLLHCFIK